MHPFAIFASFAVKLFSAFLRDLCVLRGKAFV